MAVIAETKIRTTPKKETTAPIITPELREFGVLGFVKEIGAFIVRKDLPLTNSILAGHPEITITPEKFQQFVNQSIPLQKEALGPYTILPMDRTALFPNGIGNLKFSEILLNLGNEHLKYIKSLSPELQNQVNQALKGEACTLEAAAVLDDLQQITIEKLKPNRTEKAQKFREGTINAIKKVYKLAGQISDIQTKILEILPQDDPVLRRKFILYGDDLLTGTPRICYLPYFENGKLVKVEQLMLIPPLSLIQQPDFTDLEGQPRTSQEILDRFIPVYYRRENKKRINFNPAKPHGLMSLLGKIGTDVMARNIGAQIRIIKEKIKRTKDISDEQALTESAKIWLDLWDGSSSPPDSRSHDLLASAQKLKKRKLL